MKSSNESLGKPEVVSSSPPHGRNTYNGSAIWKESNPLLVDGHENRNTTSYATNDGSQQSNPSIRRQESYMPVSSFHSHCIDGQYQHRSNINGVHGGVSRQYYPVLKDERYEEGEVNITAGDVPYPPNFYERMPQWGGIGDAWRGDGRNAFKTAESDRSFHARHSGRGQGAQGFMTHHDRGSQQYIQHHHHRYQSSGSINQSCNNYHPIHPSFPSAHHLRQGTYYGQHQFSIPQSTRNGWDYGINHNQDYSTKVQPNMQQKRLPVCGQGGREQDSTRVARVVDCVDGRNGISGREGSSYVGKGGIIIDVDADGVQEGVETVYQLEDAGVAGGVDSMDRRDSIVSEGGGSKSVTKGGEALMDAATEGVPQQVGMPRDVSSDLFENLPKEVKTFTNSRSPDTWTLQVEFCQVISDSPEVGFLEKYFPSENEALYGVSGILTKNLPINNAENRRNGGSRDPNKKKSHKRFVRNSKNLPVEREFLSDYNCECASCCVKMKVARVNCEGVRGILVYQLNDPNTKMPYKHNLQGHKLSPLEEQQLNLRPKPKEGKKSKYHPCGLTVEQKAFIVHYGTRSAEKDVCDDVTASMLSSPNVRCTNEQRANPEIFRTKVNEWIKNRKSSGDFFFTNAYSKGGMTALELKEILDILKSPAESRSSEPPVEENPDNLHLLTGDFKELLWKHLVIHAHDHDGSNWNYITAEFSDWKELLADALLMFPDGKHLQLEMDFFKGCCEGDIFQCGQIGFSDLNHRYFMLCFDLCKSENQHSAGRILQRALEMLNSLGGTCEWVLVDGGTALKKAIDNANSGGDGLVKLSVTIVKKPCHAHMVRFPRSRGGGNRGGKGSIPRYLLDQGVSHKIMKKIVGCMFLLCCIPPDDNQSFRIATELLIKKFDANLNEHIIKTHLNGDPFSLGGHMCGRPGQVASTQGMERTGGNIKVLLQQKLSKLSKPKQQSRSPYWIVVAASNLKKFHASGKKGKVATTPNKIRSEFLFAYKALIEYATYQPPSLQSSATTKRKNFTSNFIYSFVVLDDSTDLTISRERCVSLDEAFGKNHTSFTWIVPTASLLYTVLSKMLMEGSNSITGAPLELLQPQLQNNLLGQEQITDVGRLSELISELTPRKQMTLKGKLLDKLLIDTPDLRDGEDFYEYVQRRAQRPVHPYAIDTSHIEEVGSKSKKSRKRRRDEVLEKDKYCESGVGALNTGGDTGTTTSNEEFDILDPSQLMAEAVPADSKRVRVENNLGDFTRTSVSSSGKITCNCGHYTVWRWCEHCVWIDVLHLSNYPDNPKVSSACDLWCDIRSKFLEVMKEVQIK